MDLAAMRVLMVPGDGDAFTGIGVSQNLAVVVEGARLGTTFLTLFRYSIMTGVAASPAWWVA